MNIAKHLNKIEAAPADPYKYKTAIIEKDKNGLLQIEKNAEFLFNCSSLKKILRIQ